MLQSSDEWRGSSVSPAESSGVFSEWMMRQDEKKYYDIPPELLAKLQERGYRKVSVPDETLFDSYYDRMNDHWSSSTCFCNMYSWGDTFPTFFKEAKDLIIAVNYVREDHYLAGIPFIGEYTEPRIREAVAVLKNDFEYFREPFSIIDVSPWMYPFYAKSGIDFEVEDNRNYMDYTFTPEQFLAGMDKQDDRYRYRYFKRKNNFEVAEIVPSMREEIRTLMEKVWCRDLSCSMCHYGCLSRVVDHLTESFDRLKIHGFIVRVDGRAVGLSIASVKNGLGIYQYKNADNRIKGLNEFLLRETFERYMQDADTINYTEDMGVESLRNYKEHMAPEFTLTSKMILTEKGC